MNFNYTKLENGNIRIDKYIGSDTNMIIPKYLDGFYVESINRKAFEDCLTLKSVEIQSNIEVLPYHVFGACRNLKKIVLPQSLLEIKRSAFSCCRKLESIEFPYGSRLRCIETNAFFFCDSLETINIPKTVCKISEGAFCFCRGLSKIIVDKDNLVYDSRDDCNAIINKDNDELIVGCKGTVVPESVAKIGSQAFFGMSKLKSINFPASVREIANDSFDGCYDLERIEFSFPDNITHFEPREIFYIPEQSSQLYGMKGMKSEKIKEVIIGKVEIPFMLSSYIIAYGICYSRPNLIQQEYTRYFKRKDFIFFISKAQKRGNPEIVNKLMCYYNKRFGNKGGINI